MEIFIHNIPIDKNEYDLKVNLASHLHGPNFPNIKPNFTVVLHFPRKKRSTLTGTFTLADLPVAERFLEIYGGDRPRQIIEMGDNQIYFLQSINRPHPDVLDLLSRSRWIDPAEEREQSERHRKLYSSHLPLKVVQFGWMCRDGVFSIEGEAHHQPCHLSFDPERREVQITFSPKQNHPHTHVIAIRQQSILSTSAHITRDDRSVIHLQLQVPPTFLRRKSPRVPFYRLSHFPFTTLHPRATPYTSLAIRLVLTSRWDLKRFSNLAAVANLHHIQTNQIVAEYRELFTDTRLAHAEENILRFDWCVAFQLEGLLRSTDIDAAELLGLLPRVEKLVESHGSPYVATLLRTFGRRVHNLSHTDGDTFGPVLSCLDSCHQELAKQENIDFPPPADETHCQSFHVMVTPTTMFLTGPFLERSNRVIRRYGKDNEESFLRVEFREEDGLQYRFDRDVNGRAFLRDRTGPILKDELMVAGRKFEFLAYSQSALREHSVWFSKPFIDPELGEVDTAKIIENLGSFDNLSYDPTLINCPARYAARLSQAFTATEAATVRVDKIIRRNDVTTENKKYIFTDGSGGISKDLAREIWQVIRQKGRGADQDFPHAYQIRFEGSKGMLSVDYKLNGSRAIILRPSMIKFDAPETKEIEIARAICRPTPYYLNRPLIMLLEGLGVNYEDLQRFQDMAVANTQDATRSLQGAAELLETHGLGSSFRLASTMQTLAKLDIDTMEGDAFHDQLLQVAVYHVLRDLKNNARIPIPNAWTLVGVADTHGFLQEGEIFACVKKPDGDIIYLEGHVLVSRSPCIHPGDVQAVRAVGSPPEGSCFEIESLPNTVVFSIKGKRPIPSCLGGGDLDGDVYNLLPLVVHRSLTPLRYFKPGIYTPAERKYLPRPSSMKDVADFVMEYIVSDVIGLIATHWLVIADQSQFGIQDRVCLRLAKLHSDAVDYPKTGNPVNVADIPKLKFPKPDWSAPETVEADPVNYYQSQSAIGRLSRAINLGQHEPTLSTISSYEGSNDRILPVVDPKLVAAIRQRVSHHITIDGEASNSIIEDLFHWFSRGLLQIAYECNLNHRHAKPLSEGEVVIGTITQKTPQPRMRRDKISKMREMTDGLVRKVREILEGGDSKPAETYLRDAWVGWNLSMTEGRKNTYGARGFGWVALGALLDAVRILEEPLGE